MKKSTTPTGQRPAHDVSKDKLLGTVLGKCKLIRHIGKGGMGDVYLGEHTLLQKKVAVKVLPADFTRNEELLSRFRREAIAAARLEHPNIVQCHDIGSEGGTHFIIMQFVEGKSLQDLLDEANNKPLEIKEAVRLIADTARGLGSAHKAGIVHRDVKPANVLVSNAGEVKITDFGLAHDQESQSLITMPGAMMGTPHFMSPEQAEGRVADGRSDIYSLGVMLYYVITGRRPFQGESHMAVLYKHINEDPTPARKVNPLVPESLARIVSKCMAKRPEARHQNCEELVRDLDNFLKGGGVPKIGNASTAGVGHVRPSHGSTGVHSTRKSTVDGPARVGPARPFPLVLVLSIAAIAAVIILLVVVILVRKKDQPLESKTKGPTPSAAPADADAEKASRELLEKARQAFIEGRFDEALKLTRQSSARRKSGDAADLEARILKSVSDERADQAFEELKAKSRAPGALPADLVKACEEFLAAHPDSKKRREVEEMKFANESAVAHAATPGEPTTEIGFVPIPVESLSVCSHVRKLARIADQVLSIPADTPTTEPHTVLTRTPYGEYILRFELFLATEGDIKFAIRASDKADYPIKMKVPRNCWNSMEVAVSNGSVRIRSGKALIYDEKFKETHSQGKPGLVYSTGLEFKVRNFRIKEILSSDPTTQPVTPTDPAEKATAELNYLNKALGDKELGQVKSRSYEALLDRLRSIEVATPPAKAVLASIRSRIEASHRIFGIFQSVIEKASKDEKLAFKLQSGLQQEGFVKELIGGATMTLMVGGGEMRIPLTDIHSESVVSFARRRSKDISETDLALFALTEGNSKLATEVLFKGGDKRALRIKAAEAEPVLDALLAPPEVGFMAVKDATALQKMFASVAPEFAGTKFAELLDRINASVKEAALEESIAGIIELCKTDRKKGLAKFHDFVKASPDHRAIPRLADGVFPAIMATGWIAGWKENNDVDLQTHDDKVKISGEEIIAVPQEEECTVFLKSMSGCDGLSAEIKTSSASTVACLLIDFNAADDWVWFYVEAGRVMLQTRRASEFKPTELGAAAESGTDAWTTITVMKMHGKSWFFVNGHLAHRGPESLVDFENRCGLYFKGDESRMRKVRRHPLKD